ncbi:transposase [Xenorhabdus hominickii]|uniref:Transposase n=1 Tax=Xenorhabdus hominickii TaxID=351679 RepID=A0A2G0Q0A4_XENHO|nr:transposase [Xenorhabdus hominickii]
MYISYKINEKGSTNGRPKFDEQAYHDRNIVECCFGFLKGNRRVLQHVTKKPHETSVHGEIRLYSTLLQAII